MTLSRLARGVDTQPATPLSSTPSSRFLVLCADHGCTYTPNKPFHLPVCTESASHNILEALAALGLLTLQENNRLLRQHGSDLETQNLQLQQSVLLMQQQVSLLNDAQGEWQSLVRITQVSPAGCGTLQLAFICVGRIHACSDLDMVLAIPRFW